jgi:hypothetical protein
VLGRFGRFAKAFDVSTAMPLVLYLATEAELGENLGVAVDIIEAFILRRDICGLTTKNYNKLFVEVLDKIRKSEQPPLIELERQLSLGQTDIGRWPDDQEWRDAWMGRDQYKANRQGRLRFLFEAIEKRKRTALSEDIEIKSELTVEHIMPQQWRTHWPVPGFDHLGDDEIDPDKMARETERQERINELGNLTLLTHSLNAKVSNGPFEVKLPAVRAHASLALNRELNDYDHWDEDTINRRGLEMFEVARNIWRGPREGEEAVDVSKAYEAAE